MGIGRKIDDLRPLRIEDLIEEQAAIDYDDYVFTDDDDDDDGDELPVEKSTTLSTPDNSSSRRRKNAERRSARKERVFRAALHTGGLPVVHSRMGARKWRRYENARVLLTLTDPDDIVPDGSDLVNETCSAFSRLLSDPNQLNVWHAFVASDESTQQRALDSEAVFRRRIRRHTAAGDCTMTKDDWCLVGVVDGKGDARKAHPAACQAPKASEAYGKIERALRSMLQRRDELWPLVNELEGDIRSAFAQNPATIWARPMAQETHRQLVQAIAQWLQLVATSSTDAISGTPQTRVRSRKSALFSPPNGLLADYLRAKRRKLFQAEQEDTIPSSSSKERTLDAEFFA